MGNVAQTEHGECLRECRKQAGMTLRELSGKAGISPSSLSAIELGQSSPTLATLRKLLRALGTDFVEFFANADVSKQEPVFPCSQMHAIEDAHRRYVLLLPKRDDLQFQMVRETILPSESEAEWEVHDVDIGGVVLEGGPLCLEIEGVGEWRIQPGDAFYVRAGWNHRASHVGDSPAELITVAYPPRY